MSQAAFALRGRNPDVLSCIANLSNDEVFTPPELANQMLDAVAGAWARSNGGEEIWSNPNVKFLDPFTKSGVFLREVTARLAQGLAAKIPDLQERVDHILTKQVFGVGITNLTSSMARRSVYCSKNANGPHSIAKSFTTAAGNIWFERTEHEWLGGSDRLIVLDSNGKESEKTQNGRCKYCGANQRDYERNGDLETYAYAFIHSDDPCALIETMFGVEMHFDVVIGNPPYQLGSDGGTRDLPIYQKFVQQAKRLAPQMLVMAPHSVTRSSLTRQ